MTDARSSEPPSPPRRWRRIALGALVLVVLAGALLWLLRKPIAGWALGHFCDGRGLACEADFEIVSLDEVVLSDVQVRSGAETPFAAERVSAGLAWAGLTPRPYLIEVTSPVIRGRFENNRVTLGGLEALAGGGGSDAPPPEVRLTDGRIFMTTPAGELSGRLAVDGALPERGTLTASLDPARLQTEQGHIRWSMGRMDVVAEKGTLNGTARLQLESAALDGLQVENTGILLEAIADADGSGPTRLVWDVSVDWAAFPSGSLQTAVSNGEARFATFPEFSLAGASEALSALRFSLEAEAAAFGAEQSGPLTLNADVTQDEAGMRGPVALQATELVSRFGAADDLEITGQLARGERGLLGFVGEVSASGASLGDEMRRTLLQQVKLPGALAPHGEALKAALSRGLSGFDLTTAITAEMEKGQISVQSGAQSRLAAASGLVIAVEPPAGAPWLSLDGPDFQLAGNYHMAGGGGPDLSVSLKDISRGVDGFGLSGRSLKLKPWRASGRTLAGDVSQFDLRLADNGVRASGDGQIMLAGRFSGTTLEPLRLSGALSAVRTAGGWHVESTGGECLSVSSDGVSFGALDVEAFQTRLCAADGQFVRKGTRQPAGAIAFGDMALPFTTKSGGGTLSLTGAEIDWASGNGLAMTILGEQLSLPLTVGERLITIDSEAPKVGILAGAGPLRIDAQLQGTTFGGTLIPANVSADAFAFSGTSRASGISGQLSADHLLITDTREDAIYQPLVTDMTATLTDGQMALSAPLRLKTGGITLADLALDLDVVTLTGTAELRSRPLAFTRRGLQPVMLSERMRGVFTNAVGTGAVSADFQINSGQITGQGEVSVADFGFQTTALGRFEDVNGTVRFSDLIGLTTPPGQAVSIGAINPGIPLKDGELVFRLEEGKRVGLEALSFPFAGGRLFMSPTVWTIGAMEQRLQLEASEIELEALVNTLKVPDLQASGTVSGAFPVEIVGASTYIRDARLKADDDGGRLAYTGAAADGAAQANENVEMAFEALKDLRYSVLELGLDGNISDRMVVTLKLLGRNPEVVGGAEFDFNISIDSALRELLENSRYLSEQGRVTSVVARKVREDRAAEEKAEEAAGRDGNE